MITMDNIYSDFLFWPDPSPEMENILHVQVYKMKMGLKSNHLRYLLLWWQISIKKFLLTYRDKGSFFIPIFLATDIICGFPTETEEDFNDTMIICKKYKFPVLYINQFYPRPGTPAAKMKRVPTQDVKQRTKKLTEYFHSYEPYKKRIGERYTVLVTDIAHDRKHYVGHNEFYEQVIISF